MRGIYRRERDHFNSKRTRCFQPRGSGDLERGGGLILAPAHVLGPETPWENIVAFFEAADSTPVA
jgi:hypothetical protein